MTFQSLVLMIQTYQVSTGVGGVIHQVVAPQLRKGLLRKDWNDLLWKRVICIYRWSIGQFERKEERGRSDEGRGLVRQLVLPDGALHQELGQVVLLLVRVPGLGIATEEV